MFKFSKNSLCGFSIFVAFFLGSVTYAADLPVYKLGIDAAFPPWTWAEKGETKGFDWELFQYIGEVEGFKVEAADIPWSAIIAALSKGKIDILAGGLSYTCKRAEVIDYALPHWKTDYWTLVKKNSKLNCVTAMSKGANVGAQSGTTGYRWLKEELKDKGVDINVKGYESAELGVKEVENGRIDALHVDSPTARGFIEAKRDVQSVCKGLHFDYSAYAVTPGDPNKLIGKINSGIKKAYESGKIEELVRKYLPWASAEKVPYMVDYKAFCSEFK
jgi:polar amino acid transport system substrate-binding protein